MPVQVPILHRPLSDGHGIAIDPATRRLSLHRHGARIALGPHPLREGIDIDHVISRYQALRHFPDVTFAASDPFRLRITVGIEDFTADEDYLSGTVACDERAYAWEAERVAHRVFRDRTRVAAWLAPEIAACDTHGWSYRVPGQLTRDDPVVRYRIHLILQGVISDVLAGRDPGLPANYLVGNTFSRRNPPPPAIVAPGRDDLRIGAGDIAPLARMGHGALGGAPAGR